MERGGGGGGEVLCSIGNVVFPKALVIGSKFSGRSREVQKGQVYPPPPPKLARTCQPTDNYSLKSTFFTFLEFG